MACGCRGNRTTTFRTAATDTRNSQAAAQAGAGLLYEVITARGTATGRRFSSLVAATGYAQRIGGTTRPVTG